MDKTTITPARCSVCGGPLASTFKKTLLGFRRLACQQCPNVELFPLSTTYVIIYWLVLCWATDSALSPLSNAVQSGAANAVAYQLGRVSIYAVPAALALWKNQQIRRRRG